jgi:hypothetical protein
MPRGGALFPFKPVFIALFLAIGTCGVRADTDDIVRGLMFVCVGGGTLTQLESQGQADVALTLRKLATGKIGGSGGIGGKFTKSEWQGLIGGINAQISEAQAAEADKVRECLKPYMASIVDAILKAK